MSVMDENRSMQQLYDDEKARVKSLEKSLAEVTRGRNKYKIALEEVITLTSLDAVKEKVLQALNRTSLSEKDMFKIMQEILDRLTTLEKKREPLYVPMPQKEPRPPFLPPYTPTWPEQPFKLPEIWCKVHK